MRYRLMATYRGVPYEAGEGPSGADVVLFAACPPPEELGFEPATGHWRKRVIRAEVDALWESRPVGMFGGEPCLVLDDLGDRLHIAYLGNDPGTAALLGYWQIDRGVFELLTPREDVAGLSEERIERPLLPSGTGPAGLDMPGPGPAGLDMPGPGPGTAPPMDLSAEHPPPGGRSARRQRITARDVFCELADLAAIPRTAYALESEVDGALCLVSTAGGYEVFVAADGARHEARSFADEEAAYFYLFGVLAAEAIRSGTLAPAVS